MQHPVSEGATSEEVGTGHGPPGRGHDTDREDPCRTAPSEAPDRSRDTSLPSPLWS
jgi:hypothetical protein